MSEEKKFKFKKVAWISSRIYPEYDGGAEKVDFYLREIGKKQGLQIDHWKEKPALDYDVYILSNCHDWPPEKVQQVVEGHEYTFFRHDPLAREHIWKLVEKAKVNIFPSPLLGDFYQKRLKLTNVMYQPWASGAEEWNIYSPGTAEREDVYLYIGDLNVYKGVKNLIDYARDHPDKKFKIYGRNIENVTFNLPNIMYFGWLPDPKVAETLAKAKYWIQLPAYVDPFPQMAIKAYLSGCEMVVNRNLGCFSYPEWNWEDPNDIKAQLKKYQETFWTRLNEFY